MFSLTSAAAQQIQLSADASNAQQMALRVAARMDEDGNIEFGMGFDDPGESDLQLNFEGVDIVIGTEHQELLDSITLDFVELEPGDFNFVFFDSHHAGGCGGGGGGGCGGGGCGGKGGGCH